jgi:uncharacterized membrane protein
MFIYYTNTPVSNTFIFSFFSYVSRNTPNIPLINKSFLHPMGIRSHVRILNILIISIHTCIIHVYLDLFSPFMFIWSCINIVHVVSTYVDSTILSNSSSLNIQKTFLCIPSSRFSSYVSHMSLVILLTFPA